MTPPRLGGGIVLPGQGQPRFNPEGNTMWDYSDSIKLGSVTDDRNSFMTDISGITTRLVSETDGWDVAGLDATVRTDLSRDEHELILAVREYNTAKDASDEAEGVLETARELADDARFERDDAQNYFTTALSAVKHGGVWGF